MARERTRRSGSAQRYGIGEAKAHLSEIVDRVRAKGEEVVLTRHGKAVARIVPECPSGRRVLGGLRDRIELLPGWDEPLSFEDMLGE